jgi:hypothetical protein
LVTHNGWRGLIGLLVSPGVGLIFYFPLAILLPLGAKYMYKENRPLFFLCTYIIVANWIYVGTLSFGSEPIAWSGGVAWGPRYLIPVLPFIMIILGNIFFHLNKKVWKLFVIVLCAAGFYVNLTGILIWFQYGLVYGWDRGGLGNYPNSLEIMAWSPLYSPIVLHTKALMTNYVSQIDPTQYINTSWYWTAYGNAPCSYDLYVYCKHGIVPVSVILLGIIVIAAIIVKRLAVSAYSIKRYKRLLETRDSAKL